MEWVITIDGRPRCAIEQTWPPSRPVEGQVNRLKTIKRQMDGRAGVELLRAPHTALSVDATVLHRD